MKVSLEWLSDFINLSDESEVIADKLTMSGVEVSCIIEGFDFDRVVVGLVKECSNHPESSKLLICKVDVGENKLISIVCGAPNVTPGQKVPVALVGAVLPGDLTIESTVIKGEKSDGMICSEAELGISDEASGIMVLDNEAEISAPLNKYVGTIGDVLELDLTPNRPDCLGHLGVARELGVIYRCEWKKPKIDFAEAVERSEDVSSVEIADPENCPRYAARILKNVRVGDSPLWLRKRLTAVGLRPINNVVDAANYILLETGHPLHTFDLDKLTDKRIVVRTSVKEENVVTLDGQKYTLPEDILLICDAEKPVAIAGIMGLENSEVSRHTTNLLLESAYFKPSSIRRSSKKLGVSTEASRRFERGADPNGVIYALDRLAGLIGKIAGGELLSGVLDEYAKRISPIEIHLRKKKVSDLIGMKIDDTRINEIMISLGLETTDNQTDHIVVSVPTFRPDIQNDVDLIEEVARIIGYDSIPSSISTRVPLPGTRDTYESFTIRVKNIFSGLGFTEVYNNTLMPLEMWELSCVPRDPVRVSNPISLEMECMRASLLPGLLQTVKFNANRKRTSLRIFEEGVVFSPDPSFETGVNEREQIAGMIVGDEHPIQWGRTQRKVDYFDLKGAVGSFLDAIGVKKLNFTDIKVNGLSHSLGIYSGRNHIGVMGEIAEAVVKRIDLKESVYYFSINKEKLFKQIDVGTGFMQPAKYPGINRDISFIIDNNVTSGSLTEVIFDNAGEKLETLTISKVYRGMPLSENEKSITFHLKFRSAERTLEDKEVDMLCEQIVQKATASTGARLRDI